MGRIAREVLGGSWNDPFTTGWLSHPTLWFYLQALSLKVFGDGVLGLRMLTALIGAATVAALYVFARRWYGLGRVARRRPPGRLSLHVHYSRIGLNNADSLFALVGLGLFLAGWETRSPSRSQAPASVSAWRRRFYFGARLSVVVVLGFLAHQLLFSRATVRRRRRATSLTALGFLIGWGPGVRVPLYHWDDYNARLVHVGIFQSGWFDAERSAARRRWTFSPVRYSVQPARSRRWSTARSSTGPRCHCSTPSRPCSSSRASGWSRGAGADPCRGCSSPGSSAACSSAACCS